MTSAARPASTTITTQVLRLGGQRIHTRLHAREGEGRPLILYCGGAGFTVDSFGGWVADALLRHGDVWLWDYPGQGRSSGFPDPVTAERVVRALARHVRKAAAARMLVVWGHSLGGFVGAQVVRHAGANALVLETTAPNPAEALDAAGVRVPKAFERLLPALSRYSIPAALRDFEGEVLVFGAGRDRTLPVNLARKLAGAVDGATYVEHAGASHYGILREPATHRAVAAMLQRAAPS